MNYFGHAAVACWRKPRPAFVLGAMLPDLERMSGARVGAYRDGELLEGVRFHHRTDAAFHDCPTFVALCGRARASLRGSGLPRGATMAVAHVGIELLIDGLLLGDAKVERAYEDALELATTPGVLRWRTRDDATRFEHVGARLRHAGLPHAYRDPSTVAERLHRIMAGRPRLAFEAPSVRHVQSWAAAARPEIEQRLPDLLDELRARL